MNKNLLKFSCDWALRFLALMFSLIILILVGFLVYKGLPTLNLSLFFGEVPVFEAISGQQAVWDGIWPACVGTAYLVSLTLGLALMPGIGCGIYLAEYAPPKIAVFVKSLMDILAGTPSIVMGLFGFTLILFLRHNFWPEANTSLFLASACLSLLILPVLVATTCEALLAVSADLRISSLALGFSHEQMLRHIILPAALPGIKSGIILALGRVAEDTAVIMLTGVVANVGLPAGLGAKFEALPFFIYYTAAQYQDEAELLRGFGAALVLLILASCLLILAKILEKRFRKSWQGL